MCDVSVVLPGVDIYFFLESFGVYTSHFSLTFRWFDGQPLTFTHEITGVVLSRSWLMSSHLHFRAEEVFLGKRSGLRCRRLALTHKKKPVKTWRQMISSVQSAWDFSRSFSLSWDVGHLILIYPDHLVSSVHRICTSGYPLVMTNIAIEHGHL